MAICKICNLNKINKFAGVNTSNVAIFVDDKNNTWRGKICPECVKAGKPPKKEKKVVEPDTTPIFKICRICHQEKQKIFQKKYAGGQLIHVDEFGSRWVGEQCPDCVLEKRRIYQRIKYGQKALEYRDCVICNKTFKQGNIKQVCCSPRCSYRKQHQLKPPKPKKAKPPKLIKEINFGPREHCNLIYKNCECCDLLFTTSHNKSRFCSKLCGRKWHNRPANMSPIRKKAKNLKKKAYNEKRGKQGISKYFIFELMDIYDNKPPGMEVDHIIPLNGENVSGLHVPWNLQYLTPTDNNKKSNKTSPTS